MKKNFYDLVIFGSGLSAKAMSLVARNAGLSFKIITDKNFGNITKERKPSLSHSRIGILEHV